jgi:hypothetical protein
MRSKIQRATFDVAAVGGGREQRTGYVLGNWATHKNPGRGVYFWTFTHKPTGVAVNVYPPHETKASALAQLETLHRDGPGETAAAILADGRWGLGQ